jgi:uncharacterized protein
MQTRTIVHFEIPAKNLKKLSRFYSKVFGWKFRDAGMPGMQYWLIQTGPQGKSTGGAMYSKMSKGDVPRNYIGVPKIGPAIRAFKAAGGKEVVEKMEVPGVGWTFIGKDPEGNLIALFQPK